MSALVVALYDNHTAAERVRTQLVGEGFPTDRVQLTSSADPGRPPWWGPSGDLESQLEEYFATLFTREDEVTNVHVFVDGVQQGHAALTVHPRGEVETSPRARDHGTGAAAGDRRSRSGSTGDGTAHATPRA